MLIGRQESRWLFHLLVFYLLQWMLHVGVLHAQQQELVVADVPTDYRSVNTEVRVVSDDAGGFYTIWKSQRGQPGYANLYIQHVSNSGAPLLAASGVAIAPAQVHQTDHFAVVDAAGGVVVVWNEENTLRIQRLDIRAQPTWGLAPIIPTNTTFAVGNSCLLPDRTGGVYVFWEERTTGLLDKEIYGQRIDSLGRLLWGPGGKVMASGPGAQQAVQVALAPNGEALLLWEQQLQGENITLRSQKVDAAGNLMWNTNGVALLPPDVQRIRYPNCYGDGFGGLLIAFEAIGPSTIGPDVFIARVNLRGEQVFARNVCRAPGNQLRPRILQKGSEAWVYWDDDRDGNTDVYGQRVEIGTGLLRWGLTGAPLADGALAQRNGLLRLSAIHSDPVLGVLDNRLGSPGLFVQKLDSSGRRQWSPMGIRLANLGTVTMEFGSTDDQHGGTWFVWVEQESNDHSRLLYQHTDANGVGMFPEAVPLCMGEAAGPVNRYEELTVAEGFGHRFVAWEDFRHSEQNIDIVVQRLDANGKPMWRLHGEPATSAPGNQEAPVLLPMPDGVIVGWIDRRNQRDENLYLQYFDTLGHQRWAMHGLELCTALRSQTDLHLLRTNDGEVVAVWTDARSIATSGFDLYMQRITTKGVQRWGGNGVPLCVADGYQTSPVLIPTSTGGVRAVWIDDRSGFYAVFIQELDAMGRTLFERNGRLVSQGSGHQREPAMVVTGPEKCVLAWADDRYGPERTCIWVQGYDFAQQNRWNTGGQQAIPAEGRQSAPALFAMPDDDAVLAWLDQRKEAQGMGFQLYAQRLGNLGRPVWPLGGVMLGSHLRSFNPFEFRYSANGLFAAWSQADNGQLRVHWARLSSETGTVVQSGVVGNVANSGVNPQLLGLRNKTAILWSDTVNTPTGNRILLRTLDF